MSDTNNSQTTKMINQIYFELHGGNYLKQASKMVTEDMKEIKKYADLANESAEKVIKNWSTLARMSPQMTNISSAIYSKREKKQYTNVFRTIHAKETGYSSNISEGTIDYKAARTAWRSIEIEKKKQLQLEEQVTRDYQNIMKLVSARRAYEQKITEKSKSRAMTENQIAKNQRAIERNAINQQRANTLQKDYERRNRVDNENRGYRLYRSQHPELFATGGLLHSVRYQSGRALSSLGSTASSFGTGGRLLGIVLDSLGTFVKSPVAGAAAAVANLVKGISDLGKEAVQAYAEIEAIKTQLGVVFSNQTQADSMFGQISEYAVHSPFGVQQTSELAVLLKQSGVYASDLMDTLKMLGDTAGGNMEKMKRIANNYAQIVSIGKASMLDMRQFAYAGIPIFEAVSKELKVSQQELRKMISDGKVTSDIIEKVFKDLTGINGIFENATEKGAKTLKARLQNLADAKQLAFSAIGESITGIGTQTGGDSIANTLVTSAENIYQWLHDNVSTKNIEADVRTIAQRESRITELSDLMSQFKDNKIMASIVGLAYSSQTGLRDVDIERNIYNKSYEAKMKGHNDAVERFGMTDLKQAQELEEAVRFFTSGWNRFKYNLSPNALDGGTANTNTDKQVVAMREVAERFGLDLDFLVSTTSKETEAILEAMTAMVEALSDASKVTEEETIAHRETNIINAQQLQYDRSASAAGKGTSYQSSFEELYSLATNSDEYKQKQEEEHIKTLKEAKEVLKELLSYADKNGNIDITKMSYDKFVKYLDEEKRVLDEGEKLTVVKGKSDLKMSEDRKILSEQWSKVSDDVVNELSKMGSYQAASEIEAMMKSYDLTGDNKSFFENFNKMLESQLGLLEELANSSSGTKQQEYQNMYKAIMASTFRYKQGSEGLNGNPEDIAKGRYDFVPLWKRILSSSTGLSTQGMTGTLQTLGNYRDDMAIRNMASSVLSATMKSMGIDSAMSLVKTGGVAKQLRGDTGATYQVDWQATKKAIKDFATQLSASTEVITAYKNGLEQELDVYEKLIAAGYTEAESQDLKNQKTVSTKTLEKLSMDAGDQLVNAFGEGLRTASGKTAFFNGAEFVDEQGNKLQEEEIILTGNLYEFIKGELPRLREEIHEATAAELNNKLLNSLYNQIAPNAYMQRYTQLNGFNRNAALALQNPDYVQTYLDSQLTQLKTSKSFSSISSSSNEDILIRSLFAQDRIKQIEQEIADTKESIRTTPSAIDDYDERKSRINLLKTELDDLKIYVDAVNESFKAMDNNLSKLTSNTDTNSILNLTNSTQRDSAVLQALNRISGNETRQLTPDMYEGTRGFKNWSLKNVFDINKQYDMEDLYVNAAKSGMTSLSKEDIAGKTDDEILEMLSDADKATIAWKEDLKAVTDEMKNLGATALSAAKSFTDDSLTKTTETLGKNLLKAGDATEFWDLTTQDLQNNMKALAAQQLQNVGTAMAEAGFKLVAMGAEQENWGLIGAGLALAAAGGFAQGLGGALAEEDNQKDKTNKESEKLESLKSDLQKLLEQARTDALYYENNLRHQTALGTNKAFAYKSVHDAILTPKGDVVTTDPKDYLIATKTPQQLVGGGNVTVQPVINCNVVNNTNAKVSQQQQINADGSIDIITMIEEVAGGYIASSRSDDAFASRDFRMSGKQAIM